MTKTERVHIVHPLGFCFATLSSTSNLVLSPGFAILSLLLVMRLARVDV